MLNVQYNMTPFNNMHCPCQALYVLTHEVKCDFSVALHVRNFGRMPFPTPAVIKSRFAG